MMPKKKTQSPFSKLIQVGIVVKDVEKTKERFSAMGMGPFEPMVLPADAKQWFRGKPMNDARFKIYGFKMGDVDLEIIQPLAGKSPHQEFLDSKGEGLQHIAFAVEDVKAAVIKLTREGAEVLLEADLPDAEVAYVDLNAGGLVVELIHRK
jgi:methylmalonyl-CoA/ethylmalonyl-CoA epimerase